MVAATALKQSDPPAEKEAPEPIATNVLEAIAYIMGEVGTVEKRGHNDFHKYDYATVNDVLFKLQPIMAKHGLIIIPNQKSLTLIADGKAMAIEYEFTLAHKNGDIYKEKPVHTGVASAFNSKGGFDDKAANKCYTTARKHFELALFQIAAGDFPDPDADEGPKQGKAEPPKQQQANGQQRQPQQNGGNGQSNGKPAGNQQQGNGKANGQQKQAGTVDIINPGTGEVIKFEKRSLWLNFLEAKLNHSDDPLSWFSMNEKTFEGVAAALEPVEAGKAHCDRIKQLVADLKKAATDPVNASGPLNTDEPDYGSAP